MKKSLSLKGYVGVRLIVKYIVLVCELVIVFLYSRKQIYSGSFIFRILWLIAFLDLESLCCWEIIETVFAILPKWKYEKNPLNLPMLKDGIPQGMGDLRCYTWGGNNKNLCFVHDSILKIIFSPMKAIFLCETHLNYVLAILRE